MKRYSKDKKYMWRWWDKKQRWKKSELWKKSGFPGGSDSKEFVFSARDMDSIPGSGSAPGEGSG